MDERGTDTRSEMDESGGLSLSAAEDDKGQSSRHRDTIESTITCGEHQPSAGGHRRLESLSVYLELLVRSFGDFSRQGIQPLPHGPVHGEDVSQLTERRVQLEGGERVQTSV